MVLIDQPPVDVLDRVVNGQEVRNHVLLLAAEPLLQKILHVPQIVQKIVHVGADANKKQNREKHVVFHKMVAEKHFPNVDNIFQNLEFVLRGFELVDFPQLLFRHFDQSPVEMLFGDPQFVRRQVFLKDVDLVAEGLALHDLLFRRSENHRVHGVEQIIAELRFEEFDVVAVNLSLVFIVVDYRVFGVFDVVVENFFALLQFLEKSHGLFENCPRVGS